MNEWSEKICQVMTSVDFINKNFPILSNWGVQDEDVFIHSLGCSVWNALGQELGFMPVVECPVPGAIGSDIRSDSTWFCMKDRIPKVIIEFERFDGSTRTQTKLDEKISNLMEASARWKHTPLVLVLSAWSQGVVSAPDKERLLNRYRSGFKSTTGVQINSPQKAEFVFSRFIFEKDMHNLLQLQQLKCDKL